MSYLKVNVTLSNGQIAKIKKAIKDNEEVSLRISNLGDNNTYLMLTETDKNKLGKRSDQSRTNGKQIKLSKTQLKANKHILEIGSKARKVNKNNNELDQLIYNLQHNVTDKQLKEIEKFYGDLSKLDEMSGEGIGSIILPFVKKVLPKLLGTLGLAAATGAVSGATHKATSGNGINRECSCQEGGFIGTLLAGLAGSLLPALIGGKGLYRAGSRGKGIYRAGTKPKKS